ncbi:MAG: SH3 domain-containing protein [Planctomycetia bacterium]|nr:SH3 domain-containing protein [Planctomycetia bacterium]
MKSRMNAVITLGLVCTLLLSACGGTGPKVALANVSATSHLSGFASNKLQLMKASGSSGYEYGQPLWVVQCKEYVTLRSSASTSAEPLDEVPLFGCVMYLEDASNGFLKVSYNGTRGYILEKYLDEFEPQIAIGQYMKVVKCKESITLRNKPSTKGKEICQIPLGAVVYAVKDASNGFYMVEYNGHSGYALSSYLDIAKAGGSGGSGSDDYYYGQSLWVVKCKEYITLRASASKSSEALDKIPLYASVTYLDTASNGFLYVVYNGKAGYALKDYLDEFEPQVAIGQYMTVVKCKESITLRDKPSTKAKEICQIPLGEVVYAVKEAGNGFYMVEYNGQRGYALASYLGV